METRNIGYWNIKKEKLRRKYPYLTDEDLQFRLGKEKEMIELLGHKMGISNQSLLQIIISL